MDMKKFLVDAYFTEHEQKAKYMMGSSDPESLKLNDVIADLSKYENEQLGYALGNGYPALREKISALYKNVNPNDIALMNGGEETIYVTMRALLKPGDEIVVQMPSYQSLYVIAKEIGCNITEYRPLFEEEWKFDIDVLRTKITSKTKLLILNYPHNPTGACLTDYDMRQITELCKEYNLYLIADEVYRFLRIDETYTNASFADIYEKAVVLGSFSKTFAAPGLRLGWIAVKDRDIMRELLAYRHFTSTCMNLPCQWIACELMDKKDDIIKRNNAIVQNNAKLLEKLVEQHSEIFGYVPPKGATMAYVKLLNGQSAFEFCMEVLENTGVLIVPSSVLENSDNYLRVGLCRESFPQCVKLVNDYLDAKKQGSDF